MALENVADIDPDNPDADFDDSGEPEPEVQENPSTEEARLLKKLAKHVDQQGEAIQFLLAQAKQGAPEPGAGVATAYDKPHKASELSSLMEIAKIFGMLVTPVVQLVEGSVKFGIGMGQAQAQGEIEAIRAEDLEGEVKALQKQIALVGNKPSVNTKDIIEAVNPALDKIMSMFVKK